MDPRIRGRNPDYGKRPASRSPEGSTSRKLSKTSPREGSSTPNARDGNTSRRSSVSTNTGQNRPMQPPTGNGAKPFSLRPGGQKENGPNFVASPDSLSSRLARQDEVPSGQSTPRSANGALATRQDSTVAVNVAPLEAGPDHFMKCMLQNTKVSKLSNAHDQAEARLRKAEAEYQNMSKHFRDFPVIKDQRTQAVMEAKTALKTTRYAFEQQSSIQRQLAEGMGKFMQSPEVMPTGSPAPSTITVPIEDFRQLCARVSKLESEPRDTTFSHSDAQTKERLTVLEGKVKASSSQEGMTRLRSECESLRSKLEAHQLESQKLWSAIEDLSSEGKSTQNLLRAVKTRADKAASESGQVPGFFRDIGILKRTTEKLENDIQSTKRTSQGPSRPLPREDGDNKSSVEKLSRDLSDLAEQMVMVKTKHGALERRVGPTQGPNGDNSLVGKLNIASGKIDVLRKEIIGDEPHDEGKQPVLKRFAELELQVVTSLARLETVEIHDKQAKADITALHTNAPTRSGAAAAGTTSDADSGSLAARVKQIENDLAQKDQTKAEDDETIINHVFDESEKQLAEQKMWIEKEMASMKEQNAKDREGDREKTIDSLTELARSTSETFKAIKIDAEDTKKDYATLAHKICDIDLLRTKITEHRAQLGELATEMYGKADKRQLSDVNETLTKRLDAFIKSLEKVEQVLASNTNANQPSRLPNGTPTPAPNGFQPPSIRSPQVNGNPKSNAAVAGPSNTTTDQKFQEMAQKIEANTYAFQILTRQYNNLTTDDMVAKMLDQFATIWPHAKNYNQAITDLNRILSQVRADVEGVRNEAKKAVERSKGVGEVRGAVEGVRVEVAGLRDQVGVMKGRVARQEGEVEGVWEEVRGWIEVEKGREKK